MIPCEHPKWQKCRYDKYSLKSNNTRTIKIFDPNLVGSWRCLLHWVKLNMTVAIAERSRYKIEILQVDYNGSCYHCHCWITPFLKTKMAAAATLWKKMNPHLEKDHRYFNQIWYRDKDVIFHHPRSEFPVPVKFILRRPPYWLFVNKPCL